MSHSRHSTPRQPGRSRLAFAALGVGVIVGGGLGGGSLAFAGDATSTAPAADPLPPVGSEKCTAAVKAAVELDPQVIIDLGTVTQAGDDVTDDQTAALEKSRDAATTRLTAQLCAAVTTDPEPTTTDPTTEPTTTTTTPPATSTTTSSRGGGASTDDDTTSSRTTSRSPSTTITIPPGSYTQVGQVPVGAVDTGDGSTVIG